MGPIRSKTENTNILCRYWKANLLCKVEHLEKGTIAKLCFFPAPSRMYLKAFLCWRKPYYVYSCIAHSNTTSQSCILTFLFYYNLPVPSTTTFSIQSTLLKGNVTILLCYGNKFFQTAFRERFVHSNCLTLNRSAPLPSNSSLPFLIFRICSCSSCSRRS